VSLLIRSMAEPRWNQSRGAFKRNRTDEVQLPGVL
jgi:hypothetical protein